MTLSATSLDCGLLALNPQTDQWRAIGLDDSGRITVPLSEETYAENFTLGLAVSLNATQPVKICKYL